MEDDPPHGTVTPADASEYTHLLRQLTFQAYNDLRAMLLNADRYRPDYLAWPRPPKINGDQDEDTTTQSPFSAMPATSADDELHDSLMQMLFSESAFTNDDHYDDNQATLAGVRMHAVVEAVKSVLRRVLDQLALRCQVVTSELTDPDYVALKTRVDYERVLRPVLERLSVLVDGDDHRLTPTDQEVFNLAVHRTVARMREFFPSEKVEEA